MRERDELYEEGGWRDLFDQQADARDLAREERLRDPDERHGAGVCRTGVCSEPCGTDGGCSR